MAERRKPSEDLLRPFLESVKMIAVGFQRAPTGLLRALHERVGELFLESTEPLGRQDNLIEQRMMGTFWAELEEIVDARTKKEAEEEAEEEENQGPFR